MGQYIKHALESKEEDCGRLACGLISDLSGTMLERFEEYLDDFVPCLHDILRSGDIDRRMKLHALHALGDLALNQEKPFKTKYLKDTLLILSMAASMSVNTVQDFSNDAEGLEFLFDLRNEIYECLGTILVSIQDGGQPWEKEVLQQYLGAICEFIDKTLKVEGTNNQDRLLDICSIIIDMTKMYPTDPSLK